MRLLLCKNLFTPEDLNYFYIFSKNNMYIERTNERTNERRFIH